jgi:TPR repeat protein
MDPQEDLFNDGMVLYNNSQYLEAIVLFKLAADAGHLIAAEKLANCYSNTGSTELAVPYWEICRKANNHRANSNYALYLAEIPGSLDLAMQLWRAAADAGVPEAAFNLGVWLKDLGQQDEAKKWLKKSGELGYRNGFFVLAGIYYHAHEWDAMKEALKPLLELADPRALKMMASYEQIISGPQSISVNQPQENRKDYDDDPRNAGITFF